MRDQIPGQPASVTGRGPISALHRWVQAELAKPEPPPPDAGQPVPWQARVIVAALFTLRMMIKGLAWLRELYSRAWLYAWERRHVAR